MHRLRNGLRPVAGRRPASRADSNRLPIQDLLNAARWSFRNACKRPSPGFHGRICHHGGRLIRGLVKDSTNETDLFHQERVVLEIMRARRKGDGEIGRQRQIGPHLRNRSRPPAVVAIHGFRTRSEPGAQVLKGIKAERRDGRDQVVVHFRRIKWYSKPVETINLASSQSSGRALSGAILRLAVIGVDVDPSDFRAPPDCPRFREHPSHRPEYSAPRVRTTQKRKHVATIRRRRPRPSRFDSASLVVEFVLAENPFGGLRRGAGDHLRQL